MKRNDLNWGGSPQFRARLRLEFATGLALQLALVVFIGLMTARILANGVEP
jgi:hypothetical protein